MAEFAASGRHRAADRYNPLSEIGLILGRSAHPVVKSSAVLAASGGLVAAFALPAHAASVPAVRAVPASATTRVALPAVSAPAASAPVATTFGGSDVTAVAKPKPKPKPKPVVTTVSVRAQQATTANRSHTRSAVAKRSTHTSTSTQSTKSTSNRSYTSSRPASGGVLGIAASLSGIYYVYGGSTPAGFDCSGFTSYVFRQVGISLPRTAAAQQAAATRVSSPVPGDLVFFGSPAYHVGIYAGNGMMYDSPTTGKTSGLHKIWSSSVTYGRP